MPRCREFRISDYLVALVVVPLVSLVILHRWVKNRAARKVEIKKLLLFAAEEAARAEAEATAFYYCSSAAVDTKPQCVVCFSPTTTRCSRCKAVRYCSGKCQIIHWRQGHKYDCHPPDIDDSSASVHCVSTHVSELSSDSFSEPQNISSYESDDGSRNSDTTVEKVNESISEKLKVPAWKRSEDLPSTVDPEFATEKHDLDDVSHEVLDFCVQSSTANTTDTTPSEDDRAHDVLMSEASPPDDYVNCSEYPSDTLRCGPSSTESVMSDVPNHKTSENDVSSSTSVNTVLYPEVSTSNLSVLKNGKNDLPASGDGHIYGLSSEHNTHTPTSYTHEFPISMDTSSIADAGNNLPISKDHEHDNFASERVQFSSLTSSHETSGSKSFRLTPSTNGHMGDTSKVLKRSSSTSKIILDASTNKSSVRNVTNRTNGHRGDTFMPLHHSSSTSKNFMLGSTTKSAMKIASNARDLVSSLSGQKISGSLFSSSKSSLQIKDSPSFTSSVSQGPISNVATTQMAVPKIENEKASDLNGTSRRSGRSAPQQPSPLKETTPVRSTSRQKNGNYDTIPSNAFHSVVSSLSTGYVLKASVRKVAQQLKGSKVSKQGSLKIINEGSSGKSSKTLFPYELFVKLFNCDKLELPPCGLINCGNSCYANVVLQCLVFTRPIAAYLLQGSHSKTCQRNDWCFMCELQHLVSRMRDGKSPISPIRILSQLKNIGNHLGYGREEDAHEFLRFATEAMQSVFLAEAGGERLIDSKLQETTLIQQIFIGSLYSKIKCLKCHYISERYDAIMDLMVEIDNEDIESLQDALAGFTAPETLDGAEKYYCGRCKTLMKAKKQLAVHEAPNILTIVLKRFQNGKFGKLNKRVSFPEILNMKPYMTSMGDKPPAYKLYAVVVHLDMMNASFSGHYVCYVKNLQGAWFKINDCKVKQVELDKVLSQRAYMLFYSRSSPRPPSILKNGIVPSSMPVDASSLANASKRPVLKHGLEKISVLDTSSATSCTVDLEEHGFLSRVPSVRANRIMGARDYMDSASSDSGSLFSCSDEASCSTESNRDSTSTDEYNETMFGDSAGITCTNSGLPEDPYTLPSSFFCKKSSPSLQTEYYSQNNTYFQDTYHHTREIDPVILSSPDPASQDTDGLPAWLSSNASSYFFPPSDPFEQRDSSSFDSDPSSICSHSLDFRTSNTNSHADFSYMRNSNGAPGVSESGAHRQEDFSATASSQSLDQKCMPGFLHESAKLNFVSSFNALDDCLVHDTRISDSLTAESLGLGR